MFVVTVYSMFFSTYTVVSASYTSKSRRIFLPTLFSFLFLARGGGEDIVLFPLQPLR